MSFKALEGRISAEGAFAVATSELQLSQLANRVEELSDVVKALASQSGEYKRLLQNYDERIKEIDEIAETQKAEFSEKSKYFVQVVYHPKNNASVSFANGLVSELRSQGYRASTGVWHESTSTAFDEIQIIYKDGVLLSFVDQVSSLTEEFMEKGEVRKPLKTQDGLHASSGADVALFLEAKH